MRFDFIRRLLGLESADELFDRACVLYNDSNGDIESIERYVYLCKRSAIKGSPDAEEALYRLYSLMALSERDHDSYEMFASCMAFRGDAQAQFSLGLLYQGQEGSPDKFIDAKMAIHWYELASRNGHIGAKNNLAVLYSNGITGDVSIGRVVDLIMSAAESGSLPAQLNMATRHISGEGILKSPTEALKWLLVVISNDDEFRSEGFSESLSGIEHEMLSIRKNLTCSEVEEAEALARSWILSHRSKLNN